MAEGADATTGLPLLLIVAPVTGRLHVVPPEAFRDGREWVEQGQVVAEIEPGHGAGTAEGDRVAAVASRRGYLGGMMGRDGEPVRQGQPIAWMEAVPEAHIRPVEDTA